MNENIKVMEIIYRDSETAVFSLKSLLETLKDKNNKIKETITHILEGYERYQDDALKALEELDATPQKEGVMAKMASKMGIQKEVKTDNSDSAISEMLIQGISMGSIEMEQKLSECEEHLDKSYRKLAKDFLKFQEDNIKTLKKEL